jgi:orotate phosphoribosyltransferase
MTKSEVSQKVAHILAQRKAVITNGHFVYAEKPDGWYHGSAYINKDAIYPHHKTVSELCRYLAYAASEQRVNAVVGPTVGGVSLAQWTAYWLEMDHGYRDVLSVCADEEPVLEKTFISFDDIGKAAQLAVVKKQDEYILPGSAYGQIAVCVESNGLSFYNKVGTKRVLKRGYDKLVAGMRCLITEDVYNSGATCRKTKSAIEVAGGEVVKMIAICDRSGGAQDCDALYTTRMDMLKEDADGYCDICRVKGRESVRQDLGKGRDYLIRQGLTQFLK